MLSRFKPPSPAMIIACIALAIAVSGASYAAVALPRNSVGTKQLKRNAVTSKKIKQGTIQAGDIAANVLAPQAFARIDGNGALVGGAAQAKGIQPADIQHDNVVPATELTGAGVYCLGGLDFIPRSAIVALDNTDSLPVAPAQTGGSLNFIATVAIFKGEDLGRCDNAHGQVRVAIEQVDQTNPPTVANHGFVIWLLK